MSLPAPAFESVEEGPRLRGDPAMGEPVMRHEARWRSTSGKSGPASPNGTFKRWTRGGGALTATEERERIREHLW